MGRKYLQNCTCSCTLIVLQSIKHLHLQYQKIRGIEMCFHAPKIPTAFSGALWMLIHGKNCPITGM